VVLAIVVVATIFGLETRSAAIVFGVFWLIGSDEWAKLCGLGRTGRTIYAAAFLAFVVAVLAGSLPESALTGIELAAAAVWLAALVLILRGEMRIGAVPIAVAGLIVLPAAWTAFFRLHGIGGQGAALVLTGLVIVWAADIGAFFVGRGLGRTALAPKISPKKTWEGVGGGVVAAALAGAVAAWLTGLPVVALAFTAAAMALISVVGDLGVSLLKRRVGLKDCGVLLPGHGGVMDRFDGVTAALPFFALGLQFAHVLD